MRFSHITIFFLAVIYLTSCKSSKPTVTTDKEEFQGYIKYENSVVSDKLTDSDRNYYNLFGNIEIMKYASGNYLNEFPNGLEYERTLYNADANNYYLFYKSGKVKFFSAANESDKIVKIIKSDKIEIICGYECKSIKLDFGRFSMTYFYSEDLYVNPDSFENHQYRHLNTLFKETRSIYLKSIMEHKDMKFIQTAVEVHPENVDMSTFKVPSSVEKF